MNNKDMQIISHSVQAQKGGVITNTEKSCSLFSTVNVISKCKYLVLKGLGIKGEICQL